MGHQFVVGTTGWAALGLTFMKPEPNHGCVVFFTCIKGKSQWESQAQCWQMENNRTTTHMCYNETGWYEEGHRHGGMQLQRYRCPGVCDCLLFQPLCMNGCLAWVILLSTGNRIQILLRHYLIWTFYVSQIFVEFILRPTKYWSDNSSSLQCIL